MLRPLSLLVPVDARFRSLPQEIAGKYAELCGCPSADASVFAAKVAEAFAAAAQPLDPAAAITMAAQVAGEHVEVTLHGAGVRDRAVVRCHAPAGSTK